MHPPRPLLFLGFENVISLAHTTGQRDFLPAIRRIGQDPGTLVREASLIEQLFDRNAIAHLRGLNGEFHPIYCLTTRWTHFLDRPTMLRVLTQAGLQFIATNLHQRWETTQIPAGKLKSGDIEAWLDLHPEHVGQWVVLDDEIHGKGLSDWPQSRTAFTVLCCQDVGLTDFEVSKLRSAFQLRMVRH